MNDHCIDFMSLEDGAECIIDPETMSSFLCKEGSGCVPSNVSRTGYACAKIVTKLSDEKECSEGGNECGVDSFCDCNTINGKMQCIPYQAVDKYTLFYYMKFVEAGFDSKESYDYDRVLAESYLSYDEEYRCVTYDPLTIYESSDDDSHPSSSTGGGGSPFSSTSTIPTSTVSTLSFSELEEESGSDESRGNDGNTAKPFCSLSLFLSFVLACLLYF